MYIIVVGAGKLGYFLTKDLIYTGHEVTLMDWDPSKVRKLENVLGENIIYGNGSSITGLEKAGCARADVIVAATGHDEDNLVVCQIAKRYFGVKKAIARINNPKNEIVFKKLGVGTTISSTKSVAEAIEEYVAHNEIVDMISFDYRQVEKVEISIDSNSFAVGKAISELSLPYECSLSFIIRGKDVIFPKGETIILINDIVIAVTTSCAREELISAFIGNEAKQQERICTIKKY